MLSLKNQVAVITGASSGIGKSIALALAKSGAQLCLLGRNLERLEAVARTAIKDSPSVRCYGIDLAKDKDIVDLQKKLNKDFDNIDMLIHSAGEITIGRLELSSIADFDRQYKINVRAPSLLTQTLLPLLKIQKGQIVFINSSAGLFSKANLSQYAATKHALRALADSLRGEVNEMGIRVLSVFPGRTATPMQEMIFNQEGRDYPANRLLQPQDVAAVVIHALSLPRTAEVTDISIRPMAKV
jgi:short-subunit dehydrogenase